MEINERKLFSCDYVKGIHQVESLNVTLNGTKYALQTVSKGYGTEQSFLINGKLFTNDSDETAKFFKDYTGIDPDKFVEYENEIAFRKLKPCCKKHSMWVRGYPGEHLLVCQKCNTVISTSFNLGEII